MTNDDRSKTEVFMVKSHIQEDGKSRPILIIKNEKTGMLNLVQRGDVVTLTKNQIAALEIILVME